MSFSKISKHTISTYRYVEAPADYDASAITHADAQNDDEIRCLTSLDDVLALLGDNPPEGATKRVVEEWIEGAAQFGGLLLDEATHVDVVKYLTEG